jgi:hypothetical protein
LFIGEIHFADHLEGMEHELSCALLPLEEDTPFDENSSNSPVSCWHSIVLAANQKVPAQNLAAK